MSSTASRIIKNTGWLYAKMGITMFVSLYTTRLILNGLGALDFGIYNIVGGAIAMLGFLNAAMASATQRFINYSEGAGEIDKKINIFNTSYVLHLIIAVVVALVLCGAGFIFFNGILNIPQDRIIAAYVVYGSLIVSTIFTILSVPYDAILNSHENMKYYSLVGILESFLKLAVAFACIYSSHDKLIVYGILMALIPILTRIMMQAYCHHKYTECRINIRKYYDKSTMKEMATFASWNLLGISSGMIGNYGNGLVMNHFWGSILNASMGVAGQLDGMLHTLSNNMLKALNPVITKTEGSGQRKAMLETTFTGSKMSFFLFSIVCIPVFIEMPFILNIWLNNVPKWAIVFTRLQLIRTLIEQYTSTFGVAINAEGRIAKMNIVDALFNIVPLVASATLFYYGISPISLYILNIAVYGFGQMGSKVFFMHKNCHMTYSLFFNNLFLPLSIVAALIYSTNLILSNYLSESICRLISICSLSFILHIILYFIFVLNGKEKQIILDLLYRIKVHKRNGHWEA